ncbi:RNA-binding protein 33 isoform X3 [Pseudophryne corroboree]|uniref:RNA-binding protein 33 isoform X3 n=1 Tax=Pseudophryne corroboree TaxID=495146 RepID=UPI003081A425
MAAMLGDDDFDQFDKPGAERSRRRRATDDDWDSELEDDLLEEDYLSGKKISPDLSDEELNDDLLQSDEEEQDAVNFSSQGVTVSLNATTGDMSSFDLSKSMSEECTAEETEFEEAENEEVYEDLDLQESNCEDLAVDSYEENDELVDEQVEYTEEETTDEVLELEINEPLDEFQEEDYAQSYKRQEANDEQYMENVSEDAAEPENPANESEEVHVESQELPPDSKEESDEDDDEEEGGGRIRFKTERKEGTIIRLSNSTRERRNIPETLELSAEAKASLMEFEEMERQRKQGRFGTRRGGRRGGGYAIPGRMGGQRNDYTDRRNLRNRTAQGQPVRSMFMQQQHHIQPLLPMPRSRNPSSAGLPSPQQEKARMGTNMATPQKQQPKNIHINPHFKGNVAPVQVPLLPAPNQPRPAMGPPRFPGMPEFQHVPNPAPGNFNPPPRFQEPWRNPPPPPQPEREPFFIGEPRFPNHHIFDQRNPPPGPPPPLLSSNHQVPNQNPPPFNPPGQGFNQPQPRFNQAQTNFSPPGPGPQTSFNPPTPQSGFNQPGFGQPGPQTGFNPQGPQSGYNPQGPQSSFNASGNQPGFSQPNFNHPSPQPGFNQSGPQPPFNLPGLNQQGFNQANPGPQPGFNQPGSGPQPNFTQHGPGPQPGFNSPGFSRERPLRMNMQSPSPLGMPPFSPPSANRHFGPPRQQLPPGPGQPFMPHTQSNMQGPMQPIQSMHQHHHLGGPPKPPMPMQQPLPFRAHSQTLSHRMPGQQRHGPLKQRAGMPIQNMAKPHNLQTLHSRNSNLRELPIAPSHSLDMNKRKSASAPAAQVRPVGTTAPQARLGYGNTQAIKPLNSISPVKEAVKVEEQFPEEDEETRKYRLKIEEQKRLREEILKQKELRRQQQAGARKKELLERLSQQQPSSAQQRQPELENPAVKVENNCSQILPHITAQVRPQVRNRPIANKPDSLLSNLPQKIPLLQTAGTTASFQGQQKKIIKQTVQTRVAAENQFPKVEQVYPAVSPMPLGLQQTVKVAPVQGKPQEQRPIGAKRTVMQRSNSSSGDVHIAPKVRVIKLSGGGDCVSVQPSVGNPQMQLPQQRIQPQQRPQYQQRVQQKTGPVRKVTLGKGSVQQQQNQQYQQQYQVKPRPQHTLVESVVPHMVTSIQGQHPQTKVIMRGRGRGVGGQMGRGRLMPNKQNLRVVECKPQPCVVSVEGLSSSTTDHQLKNLLMSVGPIQHVFLERQRQITVKSDEINTSGEFRALAQNSACMTNFFVRISF